MLVDDRPAGAAIDGLPVLATAEGGLEALARCEVVVKTPGISRYRPEVAELEAAGVPVVGGLGLWMEEADRARVAVRHRHQGQEHHRGGRRSPAQPASATGALVAGNIGRPPWDPDAGDDLDFWVVETSSFQATDLASSPPVVAVTSLHPDHLDWHGDVETYYRDKLSVCTRPGARLTVADGDSDLLRAHRATARARGPLGRDRATRRWTGPWVDQLGPARRPQPPQRPASPGPAWSALGVAEAGDDEALAAPPGLRAASTAGSSRSGTVDGVTFVDDSLSTNVLPTLAALEAFAGRRVALLVGGFDRGIDYQPLAERLADRGAPTLVLTLPANGPRIGRGHRCRHGDGSRRPGRRLRRPARPRSPPASSGPGPTGSSCSPRRPRASGSSRTIAERAARLRRGHGPLRRGLAAGAVAHPVGVGQQDVGVEHRRRGRGPA